MIHVYVAFETTVRFRHMTKSDTEQHQSTVAVRKCSDGLCSSLDFMIQTFQRIVCPDSGFSTGCELVGNVYECQGFLCDVFHTSHGNSCKGYLDKGFLDRGFQAAITFDDGSCKLNTFELGDMERDIS